MKDSTALRTPAQARKWLRANGINAADWAKKNGFNQYTVADLLRGRLKGHRGAAHRAAIALGMKPDPKDVQL
jgi:gp16 family phage-associated protein